MELHVECRPMPNVMATQRNIGGTLCESSIIPFLVPCHKVWLMAASQVLCINVANIAECKTWTQTKMNFATRKIPLGGKSPQKCIYIETRWNLLECPKLANGSQPLVGRSSLYCKDIWRRYCHQTSFLWPPCIADANIIFLPCGFFYLLFFFPW